MSDRSVRGWAATLAAMVLAGGLGMGQALAMGGEDGGDGAGSGGSGGDTTATTGGTTSNVGSGAKKSCPSGWTYNTETEKCQQKSSGLIQELPAIGWQGADPDFLEAAVLAHSGKYAEAVAAFETLGRDDDPYVQNYLGYSHRKLGHIEVALDHYQRALALRPDYVRVHEYLGEGYLELGRLGDARAELATIAAKCGTACEPYRKLDEAIAAHLAEEEI